MPEARYFRGERPTGYRFRNLTLPAGAEVDKLTAEYKDGGACQSCGVSHIFIHIWFGIRSSYRRPLW